MEASVFGFSWLGICFILVGIYLVVVLVRGAIDLVHWAREEWTAGSTARKKDRRDPNKTT